MRAYTALTVSDFKNNEREREREREPAATLFIYPTVIACSHSELRSAITSRS